MNVIGVLLAIGTLGAIVVGIGYGTYAGIEFLTVQWGSLSNNWKAIVIVVGALAFSCSLYISWTIQASLRQHALRGSGKVKVYNGFLEWYSALQGDESDVLNAASFKALKNQMMLWGSKQVAKQVNLLFEALKKDVVDRDMVLKEAAQVYLEIRRDLGIRGSGVDNAIV